MESSINDKKIAFIICTNNEIQFNECKLYIDKLLIPKGYETTLIPIYNADSMTSGYNYAMTKTDAKYKVYMHQDVYIINKYFLYNIIDIFDKDDSIAMIGMIGSTSIPPSAIMWLGERVGNFRSWEPGLRDNERISENSKIFEVEAVDGFMMVTDTDISWRSDLFDGWDFYDVSSSFEYRLNGYKIVVPCQASSWCIHDDGVIMSLWNYDRYRKILLENYSSLIPKGDEQNPDYKAYMEIVKNYSDNTKDMQLMLDNILSQISDIIGSHNAKAYAAICNELGTKDSLLRASSGLTNIQIMGECILKESSMNLPTFIDDVSNRKEFEEKLLILKLMLRRIELNDSMMSVDELAKAYDYINTRRISPFSIAAVLYSRISIYVECENIMLNIASDKVNRGDLAGAYLTLSLVQSPSDETLSIKADIEELLTQTSHLPD